MSFKTNIISLGLVIATIASVGCSAGKSTNWKFAKSWDIRRAVGLKSNKPLPPEMPERMATSWTNTVLTKPGTKAKRGFGGRIMFFGSNGDAPVRVDGQLVVYAFDESLGDPNVIHPTRRYVFPREQFVRHESESQLGPSYSVWLPWDVAGGEQKNISLIARFEPHKGALLVGEQTRHMLPGTSLASKKPTTAPPQATEGVQLAQHSNTQGMVQQATHTAEAKPIEKSRKRMTSTTIQLSKNWHQRLADQHTTTNEYGSMKE
ncbi:MAG: hypothetical protein GXP26_16445 [Planctomycetes bacterium]|nr:hypothetical protein [Planctomycetota bacterium]